MFSPAEFYPSERPAPTVDEALAEFPEDCDWTPSHGLKGRRLAPIVTPQAKTLHIDSDHSSALNGPATVATAIASSAPSGDPSTDAHMADHKVTTTIALSVTP